MESLLHVLPPTIARCIANMPVADRAALEEIRIRQSRPVELIADGVSRFVTADGETTRQPNDAYCPDRDDCRMLLDKLSNHSLYTLEEELRRGYITVRGGHRVGLAGRAVLERGTVSHLRDIASFNIRIAREAKGVSGTLMPYLLSDLECSSLQTLLLSPPGLGKTTLLRDIARQFSYGRVAGTDGWSGRKVAIVDERSELAACIDGVPGFDVGPRTDVLDGCPKAEGMMMMIRAMSPAVVVVDEIGRPEDAVALHEAALSGVIVIASAHAKSLPEAAARPVLQQLIATRVFARYVTIAERVRGQLRLVVQDQDGRVLADSLQARPGSR